MSPSSPASSLAAASSAFGSSSAFGGGSSAFGAVQYRVGAPVVGSGGVTGSRGGGAASGGAPASGAAAAIGGAAGRQRRPSVGDVLPGAQQGGGGGGSLASVLAGLSENTAAGADRGQHAAPRNKPRLLQDMGAAATQNNENEEESTPGMPPRNARGPVGARHGLSNVSSVGSGDMVLGPGMHGNARSSLQSNSNLPSPTGSSASGMDTGRNRVRFSTQADLEQRRANSQHPTFARTSHVQKAQAHAANAPAVEIPSSGKDPWAAMQGVNMPMSTNFTGLGDNSSALAPVSQSAMAAPLEDPNAGFKARPTYEKPDSFWTVNHLKMLYLISKYSHSAQSIHEKEKWIRRLPLAVFIYEGVVQKVFEYDYAPMSELIKSKRVYLNISQEGLDDLDDLVEGKLVKALRMTTKEHQSVQAYQIAAEGRSLILKRLSEEDRQLVDELITVEGRLIHIIWEDDHFTLRNDLVSRESTITDTEDVSYVCSPYIPKTLRRPGGPVMSSNAHRASESATKESTIRDDLDEVITLSNITLLVGEWIPFGANQIVEMNMKLGSEDRCQGGYFTAVVDENSTNTQCEVPAGLTSVAILDHDRSRFTNFEAEVHFPEDEGVVQVEQFGIHTRLDGTCVYGLMVESVLDRIMENISLDNLARLLVDIHIDSSKIMESVTSPHQCELLEMIFLGNSQNRDKVNVILADRVTPKMPADRYMDRDAFENEIRQVVGDTYEAVDLGDDDFVVTGSHGVLVVGPNSKKQEAVLLAYLALRARDVFCNNIFNRLFLVSDTLTIARQMIQDHEKDPNSVSRIRHIISETAKDVILLQEVLLYLKDSLEQDKSTFAEPSDDSGRMIYRLLRVKTLVHDLMIRVDDMQKILEGNRHEANGLREVTETLSESQMFRLQEEMCGNSSDMLLQLKQHERQSTSLSVLQYIFAGILAFEMLDRLTGDWSVVHTSWARDYIVVPFMNRPMVWFLVSMAMWCLVAFGVYKLVTNLNDQSAGLISFRIKINKLVDMDALNEYLAQKAVVSEDGDADRLTSVNRVAWVERDSGKWEGYVPRIELVYDEKHGFLLSVYLQLTRRASEPARLRPETLKIRFLTELQEYGVLKATDAADVIDATKPVHGQGDDGSGDGSGGRTYLKIRKPGDKFYREVPFGAQTYLGMRDAIARKLKCKPGQVVHVHKEPDVMIADDEDVIRLLPGTLLEVRTSGK